MKITKSHGFLLGLGVMGAIGLLGSIQSVQAAPKDVIIAHPPYMPPSPYVRKYRTRPALSGYTTLTGSMIRDFPGNGIQIMNRRGVTTRVAILGGQPLSMNVGDRLQVTGYYRYGVFQAARWTILVQGR